MERLTDSGRQYHSCDFMEDGIYIFINRLRKYEDTGLTPPKVQELAERDTEKNIRADKVTSIGKFGNCPRCGRRLRDQDCDTFCGSCGQRLKWEDE